MNDATFVHVGQAQGDLVEAIPKKGVIQLLTADKVGQVRGTKLHLDPKVQILLPGSVIRDDVGMNIQTRQNLHLSQVLAAVAFAAELALGALDGVHLLGLPVDDAKDIKEGPCPDFGLPEKGAVEDPTILGVIARAKVRAGGHFILIGCANNQRFEGEEEFVVVEAVLSTELVRYWCGRGLFLFLDSGHGHLAVKSRPVFESLPFWHQPFGWFLEWASETARKARGLG